MIHKRRLAPRQLPTSSHRQLPSQSTPRHAVSPGSPNRACTLASFSRATQRSTAGFSRGRNLALGRGRGGAKRFRTDKGPLPLSPPLLIGKSGGQRSLELKACGTGRVRGRARSETAQGRGDQKEAHRVVQGVARRREWWWLVRFDWQAGFEV